MGRGRCCLTVLFLALTSGCVTIPPSVLAADSACRAAPRGEAIRLEPGQSAERVILASKKRNRTGVSVAAGDVYALRAQGEWYDSVIPASPGGFSAADAPWYSAWLMWISQPIRRVPGARWFTLIGEVRDMNSSRRERMIIADSIPAWKAPISGEVMAFANDVNFKYANNYACLTLKVTRVS